MRSALVWKASGTYLLGRLVQTLRCGKPPSRRSNCSEILNVDLGLRDGLGLFA